MQTTLGSTSSRSQMLVLQQLRALPSILYGRLWRFGLLFACCCNCSLSGQTIPALRINLRAKDSKLSVGEPMTVTLQVVSQTPVQIDLGGGGVANLEFTLRFPSGAQVTSKLFVPEFTSSGRLDLAANQAYEEKVNLSTIFSPTVPGEYILRTRFIDRDHGSTVNSNEITLHYEPEDRGLLEAFCEARAKEIESSPLAATRIQAAGELASVHNPVAVDSIRGLLGRGFGIDSMLIPALGKIQSTLSVQVLSNQLRNRDRALAMQAEVALINLSSSADATVQKAARESLLNGAAASAK